MIISCDKCKTKYKVNEAIFTKPSLTVKCARCKHVFIAYKTPAQEAAPYVLENNETDANKQVADECRIVCVCNQKGGVAKTSTCLNLASSLAEQGKRVLLIDFDVQANLSLLLGCKNKKSFFEAMDADDGDLTKAIIKTKHDIWLLPSNSRMALASKKYINEPGFEYLLRKNLQRIKKVFDFIIIDTPPSGDFYTLNALLASNLAIIPTQCDYLSMNGVSHIVNMINVIGNKTKHKLDFRGLATLYNADNTAEKVIYEKLKTKLNGRMFNTVINRDSCLQESHIARMPVMRYDSDSQSGQQYQALTQELLGFNLTVIFSKNQFSNSILSFANKPLFLGFVAFFSICLLWQGLITVYQINENVFPGPMIVLDSSWQLIADGSLLKHIVASLYGSPLAFTWR